MVDSYTGEIFMSKLVDKFGRKINYLRLSVTENCNLNCFYCRSENHKCAHRYNTSENLLDTLPYTDYLKITEAFEALGINKVRLTGGEPLLYRDIINLTYAISSLSGITDLSMTTNAFFLNSMAQQLSQAGLNRVNVSLDSLQGGTFKKITKSNAFKKVWDGIEAALQANLTPVKLNVVLLKGVNHNEVLDFARLTLDRPMEVRFIEYMPLGEQIMGWEKHFLSLKYVEKTCAKLGRLDPVEGDHGAGPARYFQIAGSKGKIGLITPLSRHFCIKCNRLRVTSKGKIKPCLFSNQEVDLLPCLGHASYKKHLIDAIVESLNLKTDPSEAAQDAASRVKQLNDGPDAMNRIGG